MSEMTDDEFEAEVAALMDKMTEEGEFPSTMEARQNWLLMAISDYPKQAERIAALEAECRDWERRWNKSDDKLAILVDERDALEADRDRLARELAEENERLWTCAECDAPADHFTYRAEGQWVFVCDKCCDRGPAGKECWSVDDIPTRLVEQTKANADLRTQLTAAQQECERLREDVDSVGFDNGVMKEQLAQMREALESADKRLEQMGFQDEGEQGATRRDIRAALAAPEPAPNIGYIKPSLIEALVRANTPDPAQGEPQPCAECARLREELKSLREHFSKNW